MDLLNKIAGVALITILGSWIVFVTLAIQDLARQIRRIKDKDEEV